MQICSQLSKRACLYPHGLISVRLVDHPHTRALKLKSFNQRCTRRASPSSFTVTMQRSGVGYQVSSCEATLLYFCHTLAEWFLSSRAIMGQKPVATPIFYSPLKKVPSSKYRGSPLEWNLKRLSCFECFPSPSDPGLIPHNDDRTRNP